MVLNVFRYCISQFRDSACSSSNVVHVGFKLKIDDTVMLNEDVTVQLIRQVWVVLHGTARLLKVTGV